MKEKVAQSCPALCDPMDYTVHGILQARILEWVTFPFSQGSSQSRDQTQVSRIEGGFFTSWATRDVHKHQYYSGKDNPLSPELIKSTRVSLVAQMVKNLPTMWETQVRSLVGKIPWRRERLPTLVFWPGEAHGLCSPRGRKESYTTERLSLPLFRLWLSPGSHC